MPRGFFARARIHLSGSAEEKEKLRQESIREKEVRRRVEDYKKRTGMEAPSKLVSVTAPVPPLNQRQRVRVKITPEQTQKAKAEKARLKQERKLKTAINQRKFIEGRAPTIASKPAPSKKSLAKTAQKTMKAIQSAGESVVASASRKEAALLERAAKKAGKKVRENKLTKELKKTKIKPPKKKSALAAFFYPFMSAGKSRLDVKREQFEATQARLKKSSVLKESEREPVLVKESIEEPVVEEPLPVIETKPRAISRYRSLPLNDLRVQRVVRQFDKTPEAASLLKIIDHARRGLGSSHSGMKRVMDVLPYTAEGLNARPVILGGIAEYFRLLSKFAAKNNVNIVIRNRFNEEYRYYGQRLTTRKVLAVADGKERDIKYKVIESLPVVDKTRKPGKEQRVVRVKKRKDSTLHIADKNVVNVIIEFEKTTNGKNLRADVLRAWQGSRTDYATAQFRSVSEILPYHGKNEKLADALQRFFSVAARFSKNKYPGKELVNRTLSRQEKTNRLKRARIQL